MAGMSEERLDGSLQLVERIAYGQASVCTDLDGVLADTRSAAINRYNSILGATRSPLEIRSWLGIYDLGLKDGLARDEALELNRLCWFDPDLVSAIKPLPGAIELVRWFSERNLSLPIVTSRPPEFTQITFDWLEEWLPDIKRDRVYIQNPMHLRGDVFKAFMVKHFDFDLHLEDVPDHARTVLNYTDASVFLISDVGVIDHYLGRMRRFGSTNGLIPDLTGVVKLFDQF